MSGSPSAPTFSTITIEEVEFDDDDGILNPFPPAPLGGPHPGVDPQGLVNASAPPNGDDAYVLAVHAVDPLIGPDPPQPTGDPATSLSTIIGLRAFEPGPEYTDVEVPIFQTPQVRNFGRGGRRFPPNPNSDTDVAVTLWYNTNPGSGFGFKPSPIKSGGQPIKAEATITALDQNDDVDPIGTGPTQITSPAGGSTGFGSALDSGSPVVAGEPGVNSDEGRAWILPDSGGSVTQGTKLTASQPGDRVGDTVAVDGNTAVVGAPGTNSGAGEVYVYNKSGGSWSTSPDFALTNADNVGATPSSSPPTFDPGPSRVPFGSVVDIDGDVIVAGARPDQFNLVGYNAFQRSQDPSTSDWVWIDSFVDLQRFTDVATDNGVGLLINQDPTDQVFRVFPTAPSPPFDRFGPGNTSSVAGIPGFGAEGDISSGTVFIGATDKTLVYEQTGTQTIGGTTIPTYNNAQTASLTPSSGATGVGFGTASLAAEGGAVAVGAPTEASDGVVYLYEKTGGSWGQTRRITAPSGASDFGRELALSSTTLYVGATASGSGTVYTYSV